MYFGGSWKGAFNFGRGQSSGLSGLYAAVYTVKAVEKSAQGLCSVSSGLLVECGQHQCLGDG